MPSLKIVQRANYQKSDGSYSIAFRLTINRMVKFEASGYSVAENQFREGLSDWVRKHPDAEIINRKLERRRREIVDAIEAAEEGRIPLTHKAIFTGSAMVGTTIGQLLKAQAEKYEGDRSKRAFRRSLAMRQELIECWGCDMPLTQITVQKVEQLSTWLKKKNNLNTTRKKISRLAGLIDMQIKTGQYAGINAFALIKVPGQDIEKTKLTWEELRAIEDLPLRDFTAVARDLFMFSFYSHGMRFADCVLFTRENAEKAVQKAGINYQTGKNLRKLKIANTPPLEAIMLRYLDGNEGLYLFPILARKYVDKWDFEDDKNSMNTLVNTYLKKIAIMAGIDKPVSFHIARHTFAHLMKKYQSEKGQSNIYLIQQALGHKDIKTTQMYLASLEDEDVNKEVEGMMSARS